MQNETSYTGDQRGIFQSPAIEYANNTRQNHMGNPQPQTYYPNEAPQFQQLFQPQFNMSQYQQQYQQPQQKYYQQPMQPLNNFQYAPYTHEPINTARTNNTQLKTAPIKQSSQPESRFLNVRQQSANRKSRDNGVVNNDRATLNDRYASSTSNHDQDNYEEPTFVSRNTKGVQRKPLMSNGISNKYRI